MWCSVRLCSKFYQQTYGNADFSDFLFLIFLPATNLKLQCWNSAAVAKYVSHVMLSYQGINWVVIFYTVLSHSVLT